MSPSADASSVSFESMSVNAISMSVINDLSPELALFKLSGLSISSWMNGIGEMEVAEQFLVGFNLNLKARPWARSLPNGRIADCIRLLTKLISNLMCHLLRGASYQHSHLSRLIALGLEGLTLLLADSDDFIPETSSLALNLLQSLFEVTMKSSQADVQKKGIPAAPRPPLLNIKRKNNEIPSDPQPDLSRPSLINIKAERLHLLSLTFRLLDLSMPDLMLRAGELFDKALAILVKIVRHQMQDETGDKDLIFDIKGKALRSLSLASELSPTSLFATCQSLPLAFFLEAFKSSASEETGNLLQLLHCKMISDRSLSLENLQKLTLVLFDLVHRSISVASALKCLEQISLNLARPMKSNLIQSTFSSNLPLLLTLAIQPQSADAFDSVAASNILTALVHDESIAPLLVSNATMVEGSIADYMAAAALSLMQQTQGAHTDNLKGAYLSFLHTVTMSSRLPRSSAPVVASSLLFLLASSSSCPESLLAAKAILHLINEGGEAVCRPLLDQNALPLVQALVDSDPNASAVKDGPQYLTSQYTDESGSRLAGKRYEIDVLEDARSDLRRTLGALLDELLVSKTMSSSSNDRPVPSQYVNPLPLLPPPSVPQQQSLEFHLEQQPQMEDEVIKSLALQEGDSVQFDQEVVVQGEPMRVVSVVRSVRKGGSTSYTFEDRVFSVPSTPSGPKLLARPPHRPPPPPPPSSSARQESLGRMVASILELNSSTPARGTGIESPRKMKRMTIEDIVLSALETPSRPTAANKNTTPASQLDRVMKTPASDLAKLKAMAGKHLVRSADRGRSKA